METNSAKIMTALKDDTGLTTAEYAVGTVAVAGLGGVLLKLLTSDSVRDLLWSIISNAFCTVLWLKVAIQTVDSLGWPANPRNRPALRKDEGMATLEAALMVPVLFLIDIRFSVRDFTGCASTLTE